MINVEEIREYCLRKRGTTESFPFNETTLVFKTGGKMYALIALDRLPLSVNLKCDPERAIELRENYSWILPGYHMSKTHWNTVVLEGDSKAELVYELIDLSYMLVYKSLPLKTRKEMEAGD